MNKKNNSEPSSSNGANANVSGSLFDEWVKRKYPLMFRDKDYAELDYTDMQEFSFWVEDKIKRGDFSNCR